MDHRQYPIWSFFLGALLLAGVGVCLAAAMFIACVIGIVSVPRLFMSPQLGLRFRRLWRLVTRKPPLFSILIATRHPSSNNRIVDIIRFWEQTGIDHEIIVYSDLERYAGALNLPSKINPPHSLDNSSSVFAYNSISRHAKGDYCIFVADYISFDYEGDASGAAFDARRLHLFLKENNIEIATLTPRDHGWRGKERFDIETQPHAPNVLGQSSSVCIFPVIKNDILKNKLDSHVFHPNFIHHYCDHYITFYAWKKLNIIVEQLWDFPIITHAHDGRRDTDNHDCQVLLDLYANIDNVNGYTE